MGCRWHVPLAISKGEDAYDARTNSSYGLLL